MPGVKTRHVGTKWLDPMREEVLLLHPDAQRALIGHCLGDPKRETCGLLSGRENRATRFFPVDNIASQPQRHYEMEPAQQIAAMAHMRRHGQQLLAIAHSHPASTAEPSSTDIAQANYPEAIYLIVSLLIPDHPVVNGFRLIPGLAPQKVALHYL